MTISRYSCSYVIPSLGNLPFGALISFSIKMGIIAIPYFMTLLWRLRKLLYLKCLGQFLVHTKYLMGISYYCGTSRVSLRSRSRGSAQTEWVRLIPYVTSISLKLPKAVAARVSIRSFPQRVENGQRERE